MLLDILDRLLHGQPVSGNDRGGVNLLFDQLVSILEELGGDDDHTGGAVTDLLVLESGELHENLGGGVLHFEQLQNSGAIVSDGHVPDLVHHHFV